MTDRTVLVTGATGLLGREVSTAFGLKNWTVKGTGYSRADGFITLKVNLADEAEVAKTLDDTKSSFTATIKGAAQRFPDKVDGDPEGAKALNVAASKMLAQLAADRDIFVIYISTDYVFPGVPGDAPYEADATPQPPNLYGQTKLDGERAVLEAYAQAGKEGLAVVLRVPVLYGNAETPAESAVNVLMDALWKAQTQGAEIKMDHWAIRYPTNTEDIGRVCHDISVKYLDTAGSDRTALPRILQFSSEDRMTKYEIVELFGEIMGLSTEGIKPNAEGNDPNASVQRPYDCHLSTKALRDLGIDVSTCDFKGWWRREVRAFRK
ncbi:hypothetical protein FZEAL_8827 [Fusarium zealandicum]|uniref:RmlD-like substrate binding domain-containing protein n=1 Tax=Fusarium zealandicum TaxID=1053134 RepID=A0A8H4UDH8_9HYPO|nr:hypothetical protein FZEAL_8827 [Fusarium zealandicum]